MPLIPTNPNDLPLESTPMDEDIVYRAIVKELNLADKLDRKGNQYLQSEYEVIEPEVWRGKTVNENYIGIPPKITPDMSEGDRRKAQDAGVRLGRLLAALKIKGDSTGFKTEDAIGREIEFTIRNEDYNGRKVPRVNDYLI